ncbi:MAG TPA: hypothetical protein VHV78_02505, partial [Gemmatimonadaceae bacterium]|nr:hypothetical protein [Gemmatimonadaceae bacterium]
MLDPLTVLDGDYKVLEELHRASGSTTYVARNLHLLRDVTVTVVPVSVPGGRATLTQLSSDTRTIIGLRNPNVIPVLEGRWLGRNAFAVVRARVRGSTLAELLGSAGNVPLLRVQATLEQVYPTLTWARQNGIALRHVSPEWVVFQQGSGRALLAFDTPLDVERPANSSNAEGTDDVCMLGKLARVMLSGNADAGDTRVPLEDLRPDLPRRVSIAADALAAGEWGGEEDVSQFLQILTSAGGASSDSSAAPRMTSMSPPRSTMTITAPPASIAPPLAHPHADAMLDEPASAASSDAPPPDA